MSTSPKSSQLRVPRFPDDPCREGVAARRALVESILGEPAPHLFGEPATLASTKGNVENLVGFAQIPVGLAGPMIVHGELGKREVVVPMATNEGALVAAYSRGMKLMNAAGGVRARVTAEGLSQHPMLEYADMEHALAAAQTIDALVPEFHALVAERTSHGQLTTARAEVVGRRLILTLRFTTGDAIGINMAANSADAIAALVQERTGASVRFVHGEDVEKRANARALIEGRGRSVTADVVIPADVLRSSMRVEVADLIRIRRAYDLGFARLGTQNHLVQAANGLAAVFLACGQDVAYITECSTGHLDLDVTPAGDLYASATLPSLLVGTVGGGSGKGTGCEGLRLLGCLGDGGARPFAEILAGMVLAGDLSLMASFCRHEFVGAHERLGRNRPTAP